MIRMLRLATVCACVCGVGWGGCFALEIDTHTNQGSLFFQELVYKHGAE